MVDVVVVGGGLAGSACALGLSARGVRVGVAHAGWGASANFVGQLQLGASPALVHSARAWRQGRDPAAEVAQLPWAQHVRELVGHEPLHPFALLGCAETRSLLAAALATLAPVWQACGLDIDAEVLGGPARPWPTASGALSPVYARRPPWPEADAGPVVALDFVWAGVPMGRRAALGWQHDAKRWNVRLPEVRTVQVPPELLQRTDGAAAGAVALAQAMDEEAFVQRLAQALGPQVAGAAVVLAPAVLGLVRAPQVREQLAAAWGCPVNEALADAPHVPGIRLMRALAAQLQRAQVPLLPPVASVAQADAEPAMLQLADGQTLRPKACVLATGRFVGGGLRWPQDARCHEPLWNLPVVTDGGPLVERSALELTRRRPEEAHPLSRAGVATDDRLRPYDPEGRVVPHLFAAGSVVGGYCPESTACADGVALATAQAVVEQLAGAGGAVGATHADSGERAARARACAGGGP